MLPANLLTRGRSLFLLRRGTQGQLPNLYRKYRRHCVVTPSEKKKKSYLHASLSPAASSLAVKIQSTPGSPLIPSERRGHWALNIDDVPRRFWERGTIASKELGLRDPSLLFLFFFFFLCVPVPFYVQEK